MSSEIPAGAEVVSSAKLPAVSGAERRRRKRAKIAVPVHIRGGIERADAFEDLGNSVDASRDGLLLSTSRDGYWAGQPLLVTFPFSNTPTAINTPRKARVIRSTLMHDSLYALAVQFQPENGKNVSSPWASTPFPNQVRVLAVESDPRMASTMRDLLQQDGYHVVFVSTTQQALDILRSETPDVLLAEVECGEISGQDLCAIVKTNERLRHIPVILLTRSALPSDYSAGRLLGAVVCMAKPCQPERLQRAIHLVVPPTSQRPAYSPRFNASPFVRISKYSAE
jgi:CheY-like chemotaxis protein